MPNVVAMEEISLQKNSVVSICILYWPESQYNKIFVYSKNNYIYGWIFAEQLYSTLEIDEYNANPSTKLNVMNMEYKAKVVRYGYNDLLEITLYEFSILPIPTRVSIRLQNKKPASIDTFYYQKQICQHGLYLLMKKNIYPCSQTTLDCYSELETIQNTSISSTTIQQVHSILMMNIHYEIEKETQNVFMNTYDHPIYYKPLHIYHDSSENKMMTYYFPDNYDIYDLYLSCERIQLIQKMVIEFMRISRRNELFSIQVILVYFYKTMLSDGFWIDDFIKPFPTTESYMLKIAFENKYSSIRKQIFGIRT